MIFILRQRGRDQIFRKYPDFELMVTDGDLWCTFGHFGWKTGAVCCGGDETG